MFSQFVWGSLFLASMSALEVEDLLNGRDGKYEYHGRVTPFSFLGFSGEASIIIGQG